MILYTIYNIIINIIYYSIYTLKTYRHETCETRRYRHETGETINIPTRDWRNEKIPTRDWRNEKYSDWRPELSSCRSESERRSRSSCRSESGIGNVCAPGARPARPERKGLVADSHCTLIGRLADSHCTSIWPGSRFSNSETNSECVVLYLAWLWQGSGP